MDPTIDNTGKLRFPVAQIGNIPVTMSSREIAELVDSRHDKVKQSIERLAERGVIGLPPLGEYLDSLGRKASEYRVGERESYIVVAQLSPEFTANLVDFWRERRNQPARLPTTAEAFASAFQMIADNERRQAEQTAEIKAISARVEQVAQTQLLQSKPQNAETISEVRKRINQRYGLSKDIVDTVMSRMTYSPKPAGMLKNEREEAKGSTYAVYWIRDVSQAFKFFVEECRMVTATQATHPHMPGRFKLIEKAGV